MREKALRGFRRPILAASLLAQMKVKELLYDISDSDLNSRVYGLCVNLISEKLVNFQ